MTSARPAADTKAGILYDANKKSMVVAYLLWIFLGSFSAHRFYGGRIVGALIQLAVLIAGIVLLVMGAPEATIDAVTDPSIVPPVDQPIPELSQFSLAGLGVLGLWGLWVLVDAFLIPGWIRGHNNRLAQSVAGA